ncbi:MAG TPA: HlyD family efflux transporter periplasmic adaptor subunit [Patescibacteria group bacterium]
MFKFTRISLTPVKQFTLTAATSSWSRFRRTVKTWPLLSFFSALVILLALLIVVRILGTPDQVVEETVIEPKAVRTYQIGAAPTITVQAKAEKTGVVTIMAQTAGVVQEIKAFEGDAVSANKVVVSMASTYGGANSASVQKQIALKSYENARTTFDTQLELINKRRQLAEQTDQNTDQLQNISQDTLGRTRDQLALNENILSLIDDQLEELEATLPADDPLILATKQQKAQALAAVNGLKDSVANLDYTTNDDNPPTQLSNLSRDIALKGLELEEKGLQLSLEIAHLNLKLARIGEALYYPQAPFAGTVERVYVKPGQLVQPGTPLMAIAGGEQTMKVVALVSADVAKKVSRYDTSRLYLPMGAIDQVPQYVATEPTDGNLFAITWCQLDSFSNQLSENEYINVDIPVGYQETLAATPFLPIDSVYQTQDEAYVFVLQGEDGTGVVESRQVELGPVYGSYVQIEEGISAGDEVILDRTVITGDHVRRI